MRRIMPMPSHADIRIKFEIDDRKYEAVGYLQEGEVAISGREMLRRTDTENGGVIGDIDENFLLDKDATINKNDPGTKRIYKIPVELRPYFLVINRRLPEAPQFISVLDNQGTRNWSQRACWVSCQFTATYLVVRRLPPQL